MHTECWLGPAGTGKSTYLKKRLEEDEQYGVLCSTSGISAVNLGEGVTTVNSVLGYYDTASLQESYKNGWLRGRIYRLIAAGWKNLIIDEVSMMSAYQLDIIYNAFHDVEVAMGRSTIGIILVGDFLQLPPVNEPYCFKAECWNEFAKNVIPFRKNYRQSEPYFIEALQAIRESRGVTATQLLVKAGVQFRPDPDPAYDGTTLFPINSHVEAYNRKRALLLSTPAVNYFSTRWGKARSEWKLIPGEIDFKIGSLVMILANEPKTFSYVNGDIGTVELPPPTKNRDGSFSSYEWNDYELPVRIKRTGKLVYLRHIIRSNMQSSEPGGETVKWEEPSLSNLPPDQANAVWWKAYDEYIKRNQMTGVFYEDPRKNSYVIGEVEYMPARTAYASTVHKVQGLTLDNVQIDARARPMGGFSMMYVALSRCRDPKKITIVGSPSVISRRINMDPALKAYV